MINLLDTQKRKDEEMCMVFSCLLITNYQGYSCACLKIVNYTHESFVFKMLSHEWIRRNFCIKNVKGLLKNAFIF